MIKLKITNFIKYLKIIIMINLLILFSLSVKAAKVTCNFDYGESFDQSSAAWVGNVDYETLWDLFPEGLELELDNSLLAKLDSQEIFKAGSTKKGDVYLQGSDSGILGRLSSIKDGKINIYGGYCDVGFG
jgi:hypothetical protein